MNWNVTYLFDVTNCAVFVFNKEDYIFEIVFLIVHTMLGWVSSFVMSFFDFFSETILIFIQPVMWQVRLEHLTLIINILLLLLLPILSISLQVLQIPNGFLLLNNDCINNSQAYLITPELISTHQVTLLLVGVDLELLRRGWLSLELLLIQ